MDIWLGIDEFFIDVRVVVDICCYFVNSSRYMNGVCVCDVVAYVSYVSYVSNIWIYMNVVCSQTNRYLFKFFEVNDLKVALRA